MLSIAILILALNSVFVDGNQIRTACAEISSSYQSWAAGGGHGSFAGISATTAYDCLRSMPFRPQLALQFLSEYKKYLQFHSTVSILRDPPGGYISPSIDLFGHIKKIEAKVTNGHYSSQFDFDWDLSRSISKANDGHLTLSLCSQRIMHFEHDLPLVSVSENGLKLPMIYTYHDAKLQFEGSDSVSPITTINDVDAVSFLEANLAIRLGYQDPDARYNHLFASPSANFSGKYSGGVWTSLLGLWQGAHHLLRFANGTTLTVETTASWPSSNGPMNYSDGEALFEAACIPHPDSTFGSFEGEYGMAPQFAAPPSGASVFPEPMIREQHDRIRGYYLDDANYKDVAVLQISNFRVGQQAAGFASIAAQFVTQAAADGKRRLILDMSSNLGGNVATGFNLFRTLFPDQPIYSATRFRATELIDLMGRVFSETYSPQNATLDLPFVAPMAMDANGTSKIGPWRDVYGPHKVLGDQMSSLYAVFDVNSASTANDPISGYGDIPLSPQRQLFSNENIIMVTDGQCASTCSIVAHLLKAQGVRSIAFGGRPRYGPMQAVGGVKGAQYWALETISEYVESARDLALAALQSGSPILSATDMQRFNDLAPVPPQKFPLRFDTYEQSGINVRNAYAQGDDSTPLQFVYEPADCHRFFTTENYIQPVTTWITAANVMFMNGSCVEKSPDAIEGLSITPEKSS
ncbi:Peptidase S41 family protein ustP [Cladobotryum mycophilum]|uniref:Peptidase S41 family protein ustP n=1 Tax=Cladobotryum mycophilum TaxID=491253 RepID=A0ABR0SJG0_9HYPO